MSKTKSITQQETPPLPPYGDHLFERVPQLYAFRLALSYQKKPGLLGSPLWAAECGVYKGYSLLAYAKTAQLLGYKINFFGLDSFAGFPAMSEEESAMVNHRPGDQINTKKLFTDTSLEKVQNLLVNENSFRNIKLFKGFFNESLPHLPERKYFFVNIDCDLYEPHFECMNYFYPRLVKNGMMFFDDYYSEHFPMAKKAVDEFVKKHNLNLIHLRYGNDAPNHTKTFIFKES